MGGIDSAILVQGGSLRTWSYRSPAIEQVQVVLSTEGRPLDADIELWHGPDNTPCKMRVYVENGQLRPCEAAVDEPRLYAGWGKNHTYVVAVGSGGMCDVTAKYATNLTAAL